jgi:aminomethyltransferase
MVDFAGWHLPVQFAGVIEEHTAVRERVGIFDVSHMGEAAVRGGQALDFLQHVTCNDVARLKPGRAQYTALTTPAGTFVDDLLIYMRAEGDYLLVVNAANTPKDLDWLQTHAASVDVAVEDASARWAQIAVQGPDSSAALQPLVADALAPIKYYRFIETEVAGARCIVSRTGYTGEYGFEVYAPADAAERIWEGLLERAQPVGLGARDTLRLEATLALYGNDIDDSTTVVEAGLGWIVKPAKGAFLGREVLARQLEEGVERKLVGFEMQGRRIARHGYAALHDGAEVGRVTSGTHSPTLGKAIGLAYLPTGLAEPGVEFGVDIRGKSEPAVVVPTPFYKAPKKK